MGAAGPQGRHAGRKPVLRRTAPARICPCTGHRTETAAARRTGSRHEPVRKKRPHGRDRQHQGTRLHDLFDRARHAFRDGPVRPHRGAQLRPHHRRRHAVRDQEQPRSHRSLPRQGRSMSAILQVNDLAVSYGQIAAVKGIDLVLHEGEITALVGANGAGKSTALLAISGLLKTVGGKVMFDGADLTKLAPHQIVGRGVVQVAEGRAILTTLTVSENLALGTYARKDKSGVAKDLEWVYALFPVLKNRRDGLAGNLSGGEQQMLAIGRAL
ncbi:Branched-chain amino acid transport ATP-binding protein livF, partial [Oxalobacteraceae bacterium IMCC9480]